MVHEKAAWVKYEVQRHVVAELERWSASDGCPAATSSSEAAGAAEGSGDGVRPALEPGEQAWRLQMTPRSIENLVESLCTKKSCFLAPFGEDFELVPLATRLTGGECVRRLLCLRFKVEYTAMPLGVKKLQALVF